MKVKGRVVLMKKNALDLNDFGASVIDRVDELLGRKVSFQLVSSVNGDSTENGLRGTLGKQAYLESWITTIAPPATGEARYSVSLDWDAKVEIPGAFVVKNFHHDEFYLRTMTLEDVPGQGRIHFVCNSWVYPVEKYRKDRIFFANQAYLPHETPAPLIPYREEELKALRGDGTGKPEEWDRVYDYACYNDLGDPDKGPAHARPVLGGSSEYPYPRRGRTGRPLTKADPNAEEKIPIRASLDVYVPRDERFRRSKMSDFLASGVRSIVQLLYPEFEALFGRDEFQSFEDVLDLYKGGIKLPGEIIDRIRDDIPSEFLKELLRADGAGLAKFPMPLVIKGDKSAWRTDAEFAREMLAGVNPVCIRRLQEFPPRSKLDPRLHGDQNSSINEAHVAGKLEGLRIEEAMAKGRVFVLDHHDALMPYLRRINETSSKAYATRTLLFLQSDGTLKPLAIELSLPHPGGDGFGAVSRVHTPAERGVDGSVWQLAKAFVTVNDSGIHQLISHWLNTHAVVEPFVIATNRQLSALHPIHKLLHPHFRDTMYINALGRQIILNAGGIIEKTIFAGVYAMEMSAEIYKDWVFTDQSLPADLVKRGMAVEDPNSPHGLRLLIEDYPYAVDGLEIWSAIRAWVSDYCVLYYADDCAVRNDAELQSWWREVRETGHGDKKHELWWPQMENREELIASISTLIWTASALHAAVNFGQYPYAGYHPNRPTNSRRFMPDPTSSPKDYEDLKNDPDGVFLRTISSRLQTLLGISLIEILSNHSSDEVYLGQSEDPQWTKDEGALTAFERFGEKLEEIEGKIAGRNGSSRWKNRVGPVEVPYTLLYPTSGEGITGKGIPNSVSI